MRLSAKAEYACLAMLSLAVQPPEAAPLRIRDIAEAHGIPERYLVQVLLLLKRSGLVRSVRGAAGGYRIARPDADISIGEILEAIDGPPDPPRAQADRPGTQALALVWRRVAEAERSVLNRITIRELAERVAPREWVI